MKLQSPLNPGFYHIDVKLVQVTAPLFIFMGFGSDDSEQKISVFQLIVSIYEPVIILWLTSFCGSIINLMNFGFSAGPFICQFLCLCEMNMVNVRVAKCGITTKIIRLNAVYFVIFKGIVMKLPVRQELENISNLYRGHNLLRGF